MSFFRFRSRFSFPLAVAGHLSVVALVLVALALILRPNGDLLQPLPHTISCVSYEPSRSVQKPLGEGYYVSKSQIRQDLLLLKNVAGCVRTYSMSFGLESVPEIAEELGMQVVAGVWLDEDLRRNESEISELRQVLQRPGKRSIRNIVVGTETQLFHRIEENLLIRYLRQVKAFSPVPVTTSEHFYFWRNRPLCSR